MTRHEESPEQVLFGLLREQPSALDRLWLLLSVLPDALVPRFAALSYRIAPDSMVQAALRLRLGDADTIARVAAAVRQIGESDLPDKEKAAEFVKLAARLPDPVSGALLAESSAFVERLDDRDARRRSLLALALHLPEKLKASAMGALTAEDDHELASLPGFFETASIHHALRTQTEERRLELLGRALDLVERWHSELGEPVFTFRGREGARAAASRGEGARATAPPRERVVNTGFAPTRVPGSGFDSSVPLLPGTDYLFWLEIGEPLPESIEAVPTPLPVELLPTEATLRVVLFAFEGELELTPGADLGEIELHRWRGAYVGGQPLSDPRLAPLSDRLESRLFFPVRTPSQDGRFRLRCNIYCRQVLVQSRVVTARVTRDVHQEPGALRSVIDYTLTQSLEPGSLAGLRPHRFSLMLNDGPNQSHSFRFFGIESGQLVKRDITLSAGKVKNWIDDGRGKLRTVSWGNPNEWNRNVSSFRYEAATTPLSALKPVDRERAFERLAKDLARLAVGGYRMYHGLSLALGASHDPELERLFREPGSVQIAVRMVDPLVFPAALVYDYHWDTNEQSIDGTKYTLCPEFREAMLDETPLEECTCFRGNCPVRAKGDALRADPRALKSNLDPIVCPSGFWGFRHALGLPLTLNTGGDSAAGGRRDAPAFIFFGDALRVASGISTDPNFVRFRAHEQALKELVPLAAWQRAATTRTDVLRMLKAEPAQVIYLYCHGGVLGKTPFISVGHNENPITPDNIDARWTDPTPLVFINGCHTTALDPETALDFVSTFLDSRAAGVVGTEVTISESLACAFAEACLGRFLGSSPTDEPNTLGDAVRGARLALLKCGNPLGLVYIPFAVESLRLHKAASISKTP